MAIKLNRLQAATGIVDKDGRPTSWFQLWWQEIADTIEGAVNNIIQLFIDTGLAQETADGALELAESAINPDGTIKDEKVLTQSMTDNAATVIPSVFFTAGGAGIGTAGSYVPVAAGSDTAVVSITNGPNSLQQAFVDAWVGVRRGSGSNEFITFRCRRNDGSILAQTYTHEATSDQVIMPMAFLDPAPTANATNTYTLEANSNNAATEIREVFLKGLLGKTG